MKYTRKPFSYSPTVNHLGSFFDQNICCVFETDRTAKVYHPKTIIALDPLVEFSGFSNRIEVQIHNTSFSHLLNSFEFEQTFYTEAAGEILRKYLAVHKSTNAEFNGLYGLFGFEFINEYYPIKRHQNAKDVNDFHLYHFGTYIVYEHDKQTAFIETCVDGSVEKYTSLFKTHFDEDSFYVEDVTISPSKEEFTKHIENVRRLCSKGEIYETVLARQINATFKGSHFELFKSYKAQNPSPYMFFVNLGKNEYMLGASPEMMIRVQNSYVEIRPISGTAKRGKTPFEDHENMMDLLNSVKEKSELDMLIDLARNDLNRVCEPNLEITDYRHVEKYSQVMHTVAHIKGKLQSNKTAFDALIACLNAGTLTGAPKIAAMNVIASMEHAPRGYYGGCVGYLGFNGNCDSAILIRSAHIKNGYIDYKSGVTLLYDSVPESEYEESQQKALAFVKSLNVEELV